MYSMRSKYHSVYRVFSLTLFLTRIVEDCFLDQFIPVVYSHFDHSVTVAKCAYRIESQQAKSIMCSLEHRSRCN